MSIRATLWARDVCALIDAPPTHRLVLMVLATHHHDKTGQCFPSYDTLAAETGTKRRNVINVVKALAFNGLVIVQKRRVKGHQGSNHYVLFGRPAFGKWTTPRVHKKAPCESAHQCTLSRVHTSAPNREEISTRDTVPARERLVVIAGGRHA